MELKNKMDIIRIIIWEFIMIILALLFLRIFEISEIFNEPFQSYHTTYCFIFLLVLFLMIFPIIMTILEKYQK